jgi:glucokinase
MYLGVDIGGTKTLLAVLNNDGEIVEKIKFLTPKKYELFVLELRHFLANLKHHDFKAAGVAAPGLIDRHNGRVIVLPNLPSWGRYVPIARDVERIAKCPVVIENDANLAALSEAQLHPEIDKVLYVTVSTGIGTGVVYRRQLDPAMIDGEGGHIKLPYKGRLETWEKFASGKAIYNHLGKRVVDIMPDDHKAWDYIVKNLSLGLFENIVVVQPDLVIIGGGVGAYLERFGEKLMEALKKYELPLVTIPPIIKARRPEEAVVFGCYDLAKQKFGNRHAPIAS